MKDFKRDGGGFRPNRDQQGGNRFGKPSFGGDRPRFGGGRGGDRGGRGSFDRPKQMFEATCSNCGKKCEVPFRPTGEKPVYCRECFAEREGTPSYRNPRKEEFHGGQKNTSPTQHRDTRIDDIKKQLEMVNEKLDALLGNKKTNGSKKDETATPELNLADVVASAGESKKKTEKKSASKKKKK